MPGIIDKLKACSGTVARVKLTLADATSVVLEVEGSKGKWKRLARLMLGYKTWRRAEAQDADRKPLDGWDRKDLDDDEASDTTEDDDDGPIGQVDQLFKLCAAHVRELRSAEQKHEGEIIKAQNDLIGNMSKVAKEQSGTVEQAIRALRRSADGRPPQIVAVTGMEPEPDSEEPAKPPGEPGIFDLLEWAGANPEKVEGIASLLERFGFVRRAAAETVPGPKPKPREGVG